jgi:hypothetical protein
VNSTPHVRTLKTPPGSGAAPTIQLLTTEEVADILRTTPGAIYNQRYRGDTPGSLGVRVGRRILFDLGILAAFLAQEAADQAAARGP